MLYDKLSSTKLDPRLHLLKFTWDKNLETEQIEFVPGLNLLTQRDQAERTIILRLIRYSMGGSHSRIDDDVMKATKEVRLEFLANGKLISTKRDFEHPSGKFLVIQEGHQEFMKSPNEMGEFLLEVLGIPKVRYQAGERRNLLSFNNLARAFIVDRDYSYTEIMAKEYPDPRKETTKLMLGLTTQEIADVEEQIRAADLKVQRLNEEIRGVERLLSDFNVGSLSDIQQRRKNLLKLLDETQAKESDLREKIQRAALQGQTINEGNKGYQILHDELLDKRNRLSDIDSEIAILHKQLEEKTNLKSLLESEARKIERYSSSHYVLSTFTFSQCPRCLREISVEMRERELESDCMLCGRPLQTNSDGNSETWRKALADSHKAVQETDQLLDYYIERDKLLRQERGEIKSRVEWLQQELTRQTVGYVSPLVEDLSLINEERAQLLKSIAAVDLEERQRRYADEMRDKTLPELRRSRDELREKMQVLQMRRGLRRERSGGFLQHFTYFMRETASNQFRSAEWDESELLPVVNNQEYTKALSGFDLAISVLAFHYALLALKVKTPAFDTAHPGLLVVDEPQQQMMGTNQYRSIMRLFAELAEKYRNVIQIIVATTDSSGFENYLCPIQKTTS